MRRNELALSPAESQIVTALGGSRWTIKRYTNDAVVEAKNVWSDLSSAVGFAKGGWITDDRDNPKFRKSGVATMAVTLHAAANARKAWASITADQRAGLASAVDLTVDELAAAINVSVCPNSTPGCQSACVVAYSRNGVMPRAQKTRLARTILTLVRPELAFAMTAQELERHAAKYGRRGARWRVNASDDLRMEIIAPGLFAAGSAVGVGAAGNKFASIRAYAYTKWSPLERPGRADLRLVYSASERTSLEQIREMTDAGHRVAVVLADITPSKPLPATWNGIPVVDGDKTDDLFKHPAGVIVGLRSKGDVKKQERSKKLGFAFPPVVGPISVPVTLGVRPAA